MHVLVTREEKGSAAMGGQQSPCRQNCDLAQPDTSHTPTQNPEQNHSGKQTSVRHQMLSASPYSWVLGTLPQTHTLSLLLFPACQPTDTHSASFQASDSGSEVTEGQVSSLININPHIIPVLYFPGGPHPRIQYYGCLQLRITRHPPRREGRTTQTEKKIWKLLETLHKSPKFKEPM